MSHQIDLGTEARAEEEVAPGGLRQIAPDVAYWRAMIANIVFYGPAGAADRGWVLVDAGTTGSGSQIRALAAERFGDGSRPAAIVLTHGHFDHVGALEELAKEWDTPVYAHPLEQPYLTGRMSYPPADPSVGGGMMARLSGLYPTAPVDVSERFSTLPADGSVPFMPGWRWLHTPGHSDGHVSFFRDADKTLIVGDAFVTTNAESAYATIVQSAEIHGPPQYFTTDWLAAERSVQLLAGLSPELVISGHGRAMQGVEMRQALDALAARFRSVAVPDEGRYVPGPDTL